MILIHTSQAISHVVRKNLRIQEYKKRTKFYSMTNYHSQAKPHN